MSNTKWINIWTCTVVFCFIHISLYRKCKIFHDFHRFQLVYRFLTLNSSTEKKLQHLLSFTMSYLSYLSWPPHTNSNLQHMLKLNQASPWWSSLLSLFFSHPVLRLQWKSRVEVWQYIYEISKDKVQKWSKEEFTLLLNITIVVIIVVIRVSVLWRQWMFLFSLQWLCAICAIVVIEYNCGGRSGCLYSYYNDYFLLLLLRTTVEEEMAVFNLTKTVIVLSLL